MEYHPDKSWSFVEVFSDMSLDVKYEGLLLKPRMMAFSMCLILGG